ncbi:MAG: glycosyltransferase family 9 protein [Planctomycetota bacterium]|jgi:ADP-heptose:LPS heptosyltransferase
MTTDNDILELLREEGAEAARKAHRGLILQPGAIGDCLLTLPLAAFMKNRLGLGSVDLLGHTEYIGILPGRTCVDGIRSMDTLDLYRLFTEARTFDLADGDPLINAFSDYAWIVTFIGEPNSDFEQNLIFTANCSHSAEVITLSMTPPEKFPGHLTDFCVRQLILESRLTLEPPQALPSETLIRTAEADTDRGRELLKEAGVDLSGKIVVIHPGSGGVHKCWHLDNFLAVANELRNEKFKVVFLLGPAEMERFGKIDIEKITCAASCLTDLSLTQVLGLLNCADGFVGNDSGITHLAAAAGVRTVGVFGPTNPNLYRPLGPAVTVLQSLETTFAEKPSPEFQQELLKALIEE